MNMKKKSHHQLQSVLPSSFLLMLCVCLKGGNLTKNLQTDSRTHNAGYIILKATIHTPRKKKSPNHGNSTGPVLYTLAALREKQQNKGSENRDVRVAGCSSKPHTSLPILKNCGLRLSIMAVFAYGDIEFNSATLFSSLILSSFLLRFKNFYFIITKTKVHWILYSSYVRVQTDERSLRIPHCCTLFNHTHTPPSGF